MTKYLLALDASTNCTGWCLFDLTTKKLFKAGAIESPSDDPKSKKTPRFPDLFTKVDYVIEQLVEICKGLEIAYIAIEQALKKLSGGSSAHTIGMLIQFNFCVMYALTRKFKCEYLYFDVRSARKSCGITVPKKGDPKVAVMAVIQPRYPNLTYTLKRTGTLKDWCFDMTDSIVIGETAIKTL
jgi:hypothetical protein